MNSGKCRIFVSGNKCDQMQVKIRNDTIQKLLNCQTDKLLGITTDNELKIDEHIDNAYMKAQRKLRSAK